MPLQQQQRGLVADPRQYITCVIGSAGIGKTTFGSQVPGHYFLLTEVGDEGVEEFGEPIIDWLNFLRVCGELKNGVTSQWKDQRPITTVVIDTYDALWYMCAQHIAANESFIIDGKAEKYAHIEDVPWGKGYARVNEFLIFVLNKLHSLGFGILLLCHDKVRDEKYQGRPVQVWYPDLYPGAADSLIAACGAVSYFRVIEKQVRNASGVITGIEQQRVALWQPRVQFPKAKHRFPTFPATIVLRRDTMWADYVATFENAHSMWLAWKREHPEGEMPVPQLIETIDVELPKSE